jgi:magnesium transporter
MAVSAMERLARALADNHPEDAARVLEAMDTAEAARLMTRLPARTLGRIVEKLSPQLAGGLLGRLESARTRELVEKLPLHQSAAILEQLDEAARESALAGLPERTSRHLRALLEYPPGTAGALMDVQVATVHVDLTVAEAIAVIRKAPRDTLTYLYVLDRDGRLVGVLNTRELLLTGARDRIEALIRPITSSLSPTMTQTEVAAAIESSRLIALPVVDGEGRLLGVVRHQEALDAVRQEAFSDLQKMVGAGADERALSPVGIVVRKRLPWLYVNLLTAFLAAAVVGIFEGTIQQVTALAVLLPVVAGQGGNTGAQALAVVMRGIALREVIPGTLRSLMLKELYGAAWNGTAVALLTAGAVFLWDGRWALALVIGLSMVVNMICAALAGAAIPLVLQALNRDPAQSSSIFMTTVTDVVGFASFLGFAVLLMPLLVG